MLLLVLLQDNLKQQQTDQLYLWQLLLAVELFKPNTLSGSHADILMVISWFNWKKPQLGQLVKSTIVVFYHGEQEGIKRREKTGRQESGCMCAVVS